MQHYLNSKKLGALVPTNNQLQKRVCSLFGLKWAVHDRLLVIPAPRFSKQLAIRDHAQDFCNWLKNQKNLLRLTTGRRQPKHSKQP